MFPWQPVFLQPCFKIRIFGFKQHYFSDIISQIINFSQVLFKISEIHGGGLDLQCRPFCSVIQLMSHIFQF